MAEFADADRASPDAAEPNPAAVCAVCGGASRVPAADRARDARCGHCRAPLLAGRPQAVRTGRWRRWMASLAESSAALAGRAQVLLLRADLDPEAGASSGLGALPGLLLLSGGRLVSGLCGGLEPDPLEDWFTQALAAHRQS
jgi:thioredoxin 2